MPGPAGALDISGLVGWVGGEWQGDGWYSNSKAEPTAVQVGVSIVFVIEQSWYLFLMSAFQKAVSNQELEL